MEAVKAAIERKRKLKQQQEEAAAAAAALSAAAATRTMDNAVEHDASAEKTAAEDVVDAEATKRLKASTAVRDPLGAVHLVPPGVIATPQDEILSWVARTLKDWRRTLEARTEHENQTAQGRQVSSTFKQSAESLAVLAQLLETRTLRKDILDNLAGIVRYCDERNYRAAMDMYIRITIGNSPWPIGATKTGIHARAGDDKIAEHNQDSVMKDPVSKNYMMAVKRLMTHAQLQRPPATVSMGF